MAAGERDLLEKAAACGEAFWLDAVVMLVRAAAVYSAATATAIPTGRRSARSPPPAIARAPRSRPRSPSSGGAASSSSSAHSSIPGEREYRFAYPPWWEVVYDGIDGAARSRYHRLVAQWLELRPTGRGEEEQEEIGRHLERAGDGDGAVVALSSRRPTRRARATSTTRRCASTTPRSTASARATSPRASTCGTTSAASFSSRASSTRR